MHRLTVRKMTAADLDRVVDIWYTTSMQAHHFIPAQYWEKHKQQMKNHYLPKSEAYVAVYATTIIGFFALVEDVLAALFVLPAMQGKGIGSLLLKHAKTLRSSLQLKVYAKNAQSIEFYKKKGFFIRAKTRDESTGEFEFIMEWPASTNS